MPIGAGRWSSQLTASEKRRDLRRGCGERRVRREEETQDSPFTDGDGAPADDGGALSELILNRNGIASKGSLC